MKDREKRIADKKGIINALNFKTNDTQQDDTIILQKQSIKVRKNTYLYLFQKAFI